MTATLRGPGDERGGPIALVVALRAEARAIAARLERRQRRCHGDAVLWRGAMARTEVLLLETGMGRQCAAARSAKLLDEMAPRAIIACGYAGGLDPALASGAVVLAEPLTDSDGRPDLEPHAVLRDSAIDAAAALGQPLWRGPLLCSSSLLETAGEKAAARAARGALAVDMESAGVGDAARRLGVPFACLRVVLDEAAVELPVDFNRCVDRLGRPRPLRMALAILRQPRRFAGLLGLARRESAARVRLGDFVEGFVAALAARL